MVADRRTWIVLSSLIASMTVISMLLMVLEPGPIAPLSGVTLSSIDQTTQPQTTLFDIREPRDWQAIVIHDTGSLQGSAKRLNEIHQPRGGLGYHFVINNGHGEADGLIEMGFRWQRQITGAYLQGEGAEWFHNHAIGISLVGDADRERMTDAQLRELVWLVQQLQREYRIPPEAVFVEVGADPTQATPLFPRAWFRDQLLQTQAP